MQFGIFTVGDVTPDPTTGAPTQTAALASLRDFVRAHPPVIHTRRPPVPGASTYDAPRLSQQLAAPLEYPSITQAWTDQVPS